MDTANRLTIIICTAAARVTPTLVKMRTISILAAWEVDTNFSRSRGRWAHRSGRREGGEQQLPPSDRENERNVSSTVALEAGKVVENGLDTLSWHDLGTPATPVILVIRPVFIRNIYANFYYHHILSSQNEFTRNWFHRRLVFHNFFRVHINIGPHCDTAAEGHTWLVPSYRCDDIGRWTEERELVCFRVDYVPLFTWGWRAEE